jgi:Zn-dependent M32 family carboxypeptidase
MTIQKIQLAGKRFVIVQEKQYRHLLQELKKSRSLNAQDSGDVAESKRRLAEPGTSVPWERIKAKRNARTSVTNGNGKR